MTNTIIIDLDNCISDDGWRTTYINWDEPDPTKRYHDYHSLAGFDQYENRHLALQSKFYELVIFTARPATIAAVTEEWLRRHCINWSLMFMRETGAHLPSIELKRAQLDFLLSTGERNIVAVYDDRPDVVKMFRALGYNANVVAINKHSQNLDSGRPALWKPTGNLTVMRSAQSNG